MNPGDPSSPEAGTLSLRRGRGRRQWPIGVAFCLPLIGGLLGLTLYPVAMSFYFSLTDYPIFNPPQWVGTSNYRELAHDPRFWLSLWNTGYYAMLAVPLGMLVGLALAMLLNLKIRGMAFYRTMFFLPTIVPLVASAVIWNQILSAQHGLLNELLRWLGMPEAWVPGWLTDEHWSKPGLIVMSLWGAGGGMVMYLAALQDVPQDLYESAELDGANAWHRFRHITLPMISPILMFTFVMGLIGAMQYFSQAFIMTNGGPWDSTLFYSLNLFNTAFSEYRLGYASAMAWIMFAIILGLTFLVMKMSNRFVYYHQ